MADEDYGEKEASRAAWIQCKFLIQQLMHRYKKLINEKIFIETDDNENSDDDDAIETNEISDPSCN